MPILYLLRHAKSDWSGSGTSDFDRPLSKRGFDAAPKMAQFMAESGYVPDLIFCSGALRTRQTLSALLPHFNDKDDKIECRIVDGIYSGGGQEYFNLLASDSGVAKRVMLIGHNPSIQRLALALSGSGDEVMRRQMATKYPTAGLSVINMQTDSWSDISQGCGHLELFTAPGFLT